MSVPSLLLLSKTAAAASVHVGTVVINLTAASVHVGTVVINLGFTTGSWIGACVCDFAARGLSEWGGGGDDIASVVLSVCGTDQKSSP